MNMKLKQILVKGNYYTAERFKIKLRNYGYKIPSVAT